MDKMIYNMLPAIRTALSSGKPLITKFYPYAQEIPESLFQSGRFKIFKVLGEYEERIISEVIKSSQTGSVQDFISIENSGLIALAENKLTVDWLIECVDNNKKGIKLTPKPAIEKAIRRVEQKIVIITGGAQGIGAGIVKEMFNEGANIIIADVDESNGNALASGLNSLNKSNKAYFVKTDVSKPQSVEELIQKTILEFGGLDIMISNAGVLKAGSLEEMPPETFKLITDINYMGFFLCSKYASQIMKIQNKYNPDFFFDIIQINSKSGLKGSNKNFAYAGGKFGGIGLTESFALELMPYNIKVNSICPGNYFDGPLWSDPQKGLFVQYLNTGKVPGAKSVDDVRKYYEKQVPAGRGVRIKDIVRAVYYVIEQEYETGQAIPVTGGQVMLK